MPLSEVQMDRLRTRHRELAEVVDSDRAVAAMRTSNIIDLAALGLRRDRVRAAEVLWGHAIRGNGAEPV